MGLNQNFTILFNPNFNDKFVYICSSFLDKTAQLIHLTRLHKNLNYGKFELISIITIIDLKFFSLPIVIYGCNM